MLKNLGLAALAALTIAGASLSTTTSADARGFRGGRFGGGYYGGGYRGYGLGVGIASGLALGGAYGAYGYPGYYGYGGCYRRVFVDRFGYRRVGRVCG